MGHLLSLLLLSAEDEDDDEEVSNVELSEALFSVLVAVVSSTVGDGAAAFTPLLALVLAAAASIGFDEFDPIFSVLRV